MAGGHFQGPIRGKDNDKVINAENVVDEKIAKLQEALVASPADGFTQEQVDALIVALEAPIVSVDPRTNGGRLAVTPAYMNTASDSAFQANATDDRVLFGWTQEVAHEISALSIYVTAIGTQGNITLGLYTADSSGEPDTLVFDIGNVDSGASADAWIRKIFTAQQLYPGKRYCIVASVAADKDVSFSYNRQDTGQQSGLVSGCWSKSTVNGGTDWTDLKKDSQPALLNIVLASTTDHTPQLVYGWTGKAGNRIALCNEGASAWVLYPIPDAGLMYGLGLDDTVVGVWIYDGGNGPELYTGVQEKSFQDGIEVYAETATDRFLGLVSGVLRTATHWAPIRCETYNTLWNADNQTEQVMFRQPFVTQTVHTFTPYTWEKAHQDDSLTIKALTGNSLVTSIIEGGGFNATNPVMTTVGYNSTVLTSPAEPTACLLDHINQGGSRSFIKKKQMSEGLHAFYLMVQGCDSGMYLWESVNNSQTNDYLTSIWRHHASYMG
jgi:hypothetical protein